MPIEPIHHVNFLVFDINVTTAPHVDNFAIEKKLV